MTEDEFTYKNLRNAHQLEKRFSPLSDLEPSFYMRARKYISMLESMKEEVSPSQSKILESEIKNARLTLERIYELREKKITSAALSKVRGGNPDIKKLLPAEHELFEELVRILTAFRNKIMHGEKEVEKIPKDTRGILLIKEDIPTFVGTDMKRYHLKKNDVISMGEDMYKTLEKRGVGERINLQV